MARERMSKELASFIVTLALCIGGATLITLLFKWPIYTGGTIIAVIIFAVVWNAIYDAMG